MRGPAAVSLAVLVAACSPVRNIPASANAGAPVSTETSVEGRILESREVTVFYIHLALGANSHVVEPRDQPGSRLVMVSDRADCPITGNRDQLYAISYRRVPTMYSIENEADRRFHTDLNIQTCTPTDR
jgi:hypothetical protein